MWWTHVICPTCNCKRSKIWECVFNLIWPSFEMLLIRQRLVSNQRHYEARRPTPIHGTHVLNMCLAITCLASQIIHSQLKYCTNNFIYIYRQFSLQSNHNCVLGDPQPNTKESMMHTWFNLKYMALFFFIHHQSNGAVDNSRWIEICSILCWFCFC